MTGIPRIAREEPKLDVEVDLKPKKEKKKENHWTEKSEKGKEGEIKEEYLAQTGKGCDWLKQIRNVRPNKTFVL